MVGANGITASLQEMQDVKAVRVMGEGPTDHHDVLCKVRL